MSLTRTVILSIIGFAGPIGLGVFTAPHIFEEAFELHRSRLSADSPIESETAKLEVAKLAEGVPPEDGGDDDRSPVTYRSVPSSPSLDPRAGATFVVATDVDGSS